MSANEGAASKTPESTLARSFSASLNDAFNIEGDLGTLHETVEEKKKRVTTQSQELEAIEQRLRKTEEALKQKQSATKRGGPTSDVSNRRAPLEGAFDPPPEQNGRQAVSGTAGRALSSNQADQAEPSDNGVRTPGPSDMPGGLPA